MEILPEASVRAGVVESGEADLASHLPPNLAADLGDALTVDSLEYPGLPYSLYLNEKYGVFADEKVRQAFSRAIDIDTAVEEIFFGQFPRAWSDPRLDDARPTTPRSKEPGRSTPTLPAHCSTRPAGRSATPTASAPRTASVCRRDGSRGRRCRTTAPRWRTPSSPTSRRSASRWCARCSSPVRTTSSTARSTFDLTDWGFSGVDPDLLRSHLHTDGFQNASQVSDPALDALLERRRDDIGPSTRGRHLRAVQQWNAEHVAIVPLYSPSLITAVGERVSGLAYDLYGRPLFYDVSVG